MRSLWIGLLLVLLCWVPSCSRERSSVPSTLRWYVFDEPSGAFEQAARDCSRASAGRYEVRIAPLPADADQQREQLVRRLAAGDRDIDVIGMDVIWTAEFAEARWILPWTGADAEAATAGRLLATVHSATYQGRLRAVPFTTNTQLLWYRKDRVQRPPRTWSEMIVVAEAIGDNGRIQVQGERYEGLTVLFTSLLASAGGEVLGEGGSEVSLPEAPTLQALQVMQALATSSAADPALSTTREDQARLAFERGGSTFMLNYTFVWPSAKRNAPEVAANMGWARWPGVVEERPSRVTIGGINLGVSAHSRNPELAFEAALCLAADEHQMIAAEKGGLLPTSERLYEAPRIADVFPFADVIRATLRDAVQRAQSPVYADISLAISRTLHPMDDIEPHRDAQKLRRIIGRALNSEGLL
jgi:multiple sugar transport system substrate-binding protein